ncbi:MAG: hypothetical protein IT182_15715 [Acidobacteria bacterium]|nr:hypothetical protein [Acidobacteriota bacterium]
MTFERRLLMGWTRDLALAYVGGLIVGAPLALAAVWLTGIRWLTTVCLLGAMVVLFVALRRRATTSVSTPVPVLVASPDDALPVRPRRVA